MRYVSKDIDKISNKAKCLAKNFTFINTFPNSFIGLIIHLKDFKGEKAELDRVYFLSDNFEFISHKTARDFLMGMGINFNNIAIDSRIQNIFNHFGLPIPNSYSKKTYEETESQIVNKICKPLKIEPVKFDRILYQNYSKILAE